MFDEGDTFANAAPAAAPRSDATLAEAQARREAFAVRQRLAATQRLLSLITDQKDASVRVNRINVNGAKRTREGTMEKIIAPVLKARTMGELVRSLRHTAYKVNGLAIFDTFEVALDATNDGGLFERNDGKESIDVTFNVKERRKARAQTGTSVGNEEGNAYASLNLNNALGIADKFEANFTTGTQTTSSFTARLSAPIDADPDRVAEVLAYQRFTSYVPSSAYSTNIRGASLGYKFPSRSGEHEIGYDLAWRTVQPTDVVARMFSWLEQGKSASLSIRSQAGHSLKSSISHTFVRDTRNDALLPTNGYYLKLRQELAGAGGDVRFLKHEFESQAAQPLGRRTACSAALRAGLTMPLRSDLTNLTDRFFLGGPATLRGFKHNGLGPRDDGDALGGDVYWAAGASVFAPLPKVPHTWPLYAHAWVNAGALLPLNKAIPPMTTLSELVKKPSAAAGFGLVYRHSLVRLELNFCVPLAAHRTEQIKKGVQFGLGISFL